MGKAVPEQHPAVVLRSHYNHLRALLIAALIAVLGLAGAVVIVANDDDTVVSTSTPAIESGTGSPDAGPLPQRRLDGAVDTAPPARSDGGPNEGSADIAPKPDVTMSKPIGHSSVLSQSTRSDLSQSTRSDGGPNEGSADVTSGSGGNTAVNPQTGTGRSDGGPNEGSADVTSKSGGEASVMSQTDGFHFSGN